MKAETPEGYKGKANYRQKNLNGNFGGFGPCLWDLWSFELERSALESPAFPFFLLLVQLKILNVDKTASKWL